MRDVTKKTEEKNFDLSVGSLSALFVVTHAWWFGFILVSLIGNGEMNHSLGMLGILGFPFLPIVFYLILRKTKHRGPDVGPVATYLLLALLVVIIYFMSI